MSFRRATGVVRVARGENFYAKHNSKSFLLAPHSIPTPARRNDMFFTFKAILIFQSINRLL